MSELVFYEVVVVLCGLALLAAFVWVLFFSNKAMWHEKIARLGGRRPMTLDEFYRTFYADSGLPRVIVGQLVREVSKSIEVPAGLLRPQDRLLVELADLDPNRWGLDGGLAELTFVAERREKKLGVKLDLTKIETLDDYIKTFRALEVSTLSRGASAEGRG